MPTARRTPIGLRRRHWRPRPMLSFRSTPSCVARMRSRAHPRRNSPLSIACYSNSLDGVSALHKHVATNPISPNRPRHVCIVFVEVPQRQARVSPRMRTRLMTSASDIRERPAATWGSVVMNDQLLDHVLAQDLFVRFLKIQPFQTRTQAPLPRHRAEVPSRLSRARHPTAQLGYDIPFTIL